MPYFVATYTYTDDSATRDAVRPAHREHLARFAGDEGLPDVVLVLSGPTDDGGAVLVFEATSPAAVERVLDSDPFTTEGVVASRRVVGWNPVLGRLKDRLGVLGAEG